MAEILRPADVSLSEESNRVVITIEGESEQEDPTLLEYTPIKDTDGEVHHLCLNRGGRVMESDRTLETYGDPHGPYTEQLTDDAIMAVGCYIQIFELHGVPENEIYDRLSAAIPELYAEYEAWVEDLTVKDRRLRLLDQAEADSQFDPIYDDILQEGEWRTVAHDQDLEGFAKGLQRRLEFDARGCYRNGRIVLQDDRYWENANVQYVEGIGLSKHAARITGHAWVEHNERVVEVTWPWHTLLPTEDTIYFGRPVSRSELRQAWDNHERGPYILSTEAVETGRRS